MVKIAFFRVYAKKIFFLKYRFFKDNIKVITKYINFLPEKSIFPPEISKVSTRNIKKFQPDEIKCQPFKEIFPPEK